MNLFRQFKLLLAVLVVIAGLYVLLGERLFPSNHYANKQCSIWVDGVVSEVPCTDVHKLSCDSVVVLMPLLSAEKLGSHPALLNFADQHLNLRTELGVLRPQMNQVFRKAMLPSDKPRVPIYRYDRLQPFFFGADEIDVLHRSDSLWVTCTCGSVWDNTRLAMQLLDGKSAVKKSNRPGFLATDGSNSLPVLEVFMKEERLVDRDKVSMSASIIHPGSQPEKRKGKIRIRGFSSRSFPKMNFNIDLDAPSTLGYAQFSPNDRYVLHGPYGDLSLIRNAFTYRIARAMGLKSPDQAVVELVINDQYLGVYHLFTKPHRDDDDTEGVIQIDRDKPDEYRFSVLTKQAYNLKHIDADIDTLDITNAVRAFENGLLEKQLPGIETEAFIDYFILNELAKNPDAFRLSTYFDLINVADSLVLVPGSVWDFNMAWAITKIQESHLPVGWVIDNPENDAGPWQLLVDLPKFQERLRERYAELRKTHLNDKRLYAIMDEAYLQVQPGLERNMKRFPLYEGVYGWPNFQAPKSAAYEVARIKSWTAERLRWMDEMLIDDRRW